MHSKNTVHDEQAQLRACDDNNLMMDDCASSLSEEISAYLFVSTKPVSVERLTELAGQNEEEIRKCIEKINYGLIEADLGFEIIEIQDSFQMRTKLSVTKALHKLITPKMKRLSKAAAETLAVIAYKQPVSKAEIEVIRGVDPVPTLKTLMDGKLIRIVGREDTPGSPALYGTTDHFLERFGLKTLSELPTVRELDMFVDDETGEAASLDEDEISGDSMESDEQLLQDHETEKNNDPITIN